MMTRSTSTLLLAAGVAAGTAIAGWWAVPAVAALWAAALTARGDAMPLSGAAAAIGGALGWTVLLLVDAGRGRLGAVAKMLGGAMGVPSVVLVLVTVAFAALLAWSAAVLVGALTLPVVIRLRGSR